VMSTLASQSPMTVNSTKLYVVPEPAHPINGETFDETD
jgi:hypothetical protein